MHIVINHLTRMQKGFMCTAGIDPETLRHVRPMLSGMMKTDMLAVHGGPFELARVVDLGETRFVGRVPEIEDRHFEAEAARVVDEVAEGEFWELMTGVAEDSLDSIFGPELKPMGRDTCGIPENHGLRSLGCYWAKGAALLLLDEENRPRIRFSFSEGERKYQVPVTDIRLYGADHVTPDAGAVARFHAAIAGNPRTLVSIGLSRAYQPRDHEAPVHWLQVNNIHVR